MKRLTETLLRRISHFIRWLKRPFFQPYRSRIIEGELPKRLRAKHVYIVEEDGYKEHVSMLCPCGCRQVLHMNLIPDERPCWKVTEHLDETISLHPSVWRKKGCQSHFWLKNGRVRWC